MAAAAVPSLAAPLGAAALAAGRLVTSASASTSARAAPLPAPRAARRRRRAVLGGCLASSARSASPRELRIRACIWGPPGCAALKREDAQLLAGGLPERLEPEAMLPCSDSRPGGASCAQPGALRPPHVGEGAMRRASSGLGGHAPARRRHAMACGEPVASWGRLWCASKENGSGPRGNAGAPRATGGVEGAGKLGVAMNRRVRQGCKKVPNRIAPVRRSGARPAVQRWPCSDQ